MKSSLTIFEEYQIRRLYDEKSEIWFFSVIDIIQALTQQPNYQTARKYWNKLKERLKKEGSKSVTNCHRLKLEAADGKKYLTDVANAETLLRLIQSVPSPKAEPIKLWLAKVGYERMQEIADPARSLDRARETWKKHGHSEKWIQQRMMGQETRNKLTDYWKKNGIKESEEFAILTNIIHQEWAEISIKEHKKAKGLKSQNLRDHMSEAELIFTALAELSTRQIAETMHAEGMHENKIASKQGGSVSKNARIELENKTGRKIITTDNYLSPKISSDELIWNYHIGDNEKIAEADTAPTAVAICTSMASSPRIVNPQLDSWIEAKQLFFLLQEDSYSWEKGRKIVRCIGDSLTDLFGSSYKRPDDTPSLYEFVEKTFVQEKGWNLKKDNPLLYKKFRNLDDVHKKYTKHFSLAKAELARASFATYKQICDFMETGRQVWLWYLQKLASNKPDQLIEFNTPFTYIKNT